MPALQLFSISYLIFLAHLHFIVAAAVLVSLCLHLYPPPLSLSLTLIFLVSFFLPLTPPVFLTIFFFHPSLPHFLLSLTERLQAPAVQTVC